MRTVNGKPIRARGTNDFRPSRKPLNLDMVESKGSSTSALVADAAIYYECSDSDIAPHPTLPNETILVPSQETAETHIAPRESYTRSHHLRLFPQDLEFADVAVTQTAKDGSRVVVTNPKVMWKSDRTLLRQGKPGTLDELNSRGNRITRVTSRTKRKITELETPICVEVPTDTEIDD